jgi:hypothetical protein
MACGATLKRNHEFDPLISPGRSPKRMCVTKDLMSPSSLRKTYSPTHSAAFVEAAQKLVNVSGQYSAHSHQSVSQSSLKLSLSSETIDDTLSQNAYQSSSSVSMMSSPPRSPSDSSVAPSLSRCTLTSPSASVSRLKDEQLFSLSQVDVIVRRIVNDHETNLRDKFNRVLHNKLSEQHEAFVKFTTDQLSRRFNSQQTDCSYVS